jgi:uncharacterized protein YggU (UPF0235/DUF167 family)
VLCVRVRARAVGGAANESVRRQVARAFALPAGAVTLRAGARSRTKVLEVAGGDPARLAALLGPGSSDRNPARS